MYCLQDKSDLEGLVNILRRRYAYVNFSFCERSLFLFPTDFMLDMSKGLGYKIANIDFDPNHVPYVGSSTAYLPNNCRGYANDPLIQRKYNFMFSLTMKEHIAINLSARQMIVPLVKTGDCYYAQCSLGQIFTEEDDDIFEI